MDTFNLMDYVQEIQEISKKCECTVTAAVDRMIVNLNTFHEYHRGTGTLNYNVLGQQWSALTYDQKITQKNAVKTLVSQSSRNRTRRP